MARRMKGCMAELVIRWMDRLAGLGDGWLTGCILA